MKNHKCNVVVFSYKKIHPKWVRPHRHRVVEYDGVSVVESAVHHNQILPSNGSKGPMVVPSVDVTFASILRPDASLDRSTTKECRRRRHLLFRPIFRSATDYPVNTAPDDSIPPSPSESEKCIKWRSRAATIERRKRPEWRSQKSASLPKLSNSILALSFGAVDSASSLFFSRVNSLVY